ncbi:MAG: sigma-70 family RNA polymerase sigma factor [Planctomycetota bacterium]
MKNHEDHGAWQSFVDVYSPLVYGFCRKRGMQGQDAADVTQEVLVRVAKAIGKFEYDPGKGLFRDWLARIVSNEICRLHSKRKSEVELIEGNLEDSPAFQSLWNVSFQQRLLEVALDRSKEGFSETTWKLFEQSWIEKIPVSQVAENCNVSPDQVYVARSRVLKKLRYEVCLLADDAI